MLEWKKSDAHFLNKKEQHYNLYDDSKTNYIRATLVINFNWGDHWVWYSDGGINVFLEKPQSIDEAIDIIIKELKKRKEKELLEINTELKDLFDYLWTKENGGN